MVNNMLRNNRPKYYEAGGLLEMLTRSRPTMSFEQRSRDQVARDLLRNETEEPPRMMLYGGGLAALRRASGGMIPGYAFGGSMAGAYGGSPMKGTSAQPFGQKGGGWGSTPTAPAQTGFTPAQTGFVPGAANSPGGVKSQFLPGGGWGNAKTVPGSTGGLATGIDGAFGSFTGSIPQQQLGGLQYGQQQRQQRQGSAAMLRDMQQQEQQRQMPQPQQGMQASLSEEGGPSGRNPYGPNGEWSGTGGPGLSVSAPPPQRFQPMQQQMQRREQMESQYATQPGQMQLMSWEDLEGPSGYAPMEEPFNPYGGTGMAPSSLPQAGPTYQAQPLPDGYGSPTQYAGYGGPASFSSRQEFVSPEVASQYADLTDSIMAVGTKPYEQYQGPQLASFTPEEQAAQAATAAYSTGEGPQGTLQAESTFDQAATSIGQVGADSQSLAKASAATTRAIGAKDPTQSKSADLSTYMSDYTQNVTDPQLQQLMEFQKQQSQELGSTAAGAGAFGGYRQGLMQGQQAQQASQQAADIIGKGQQDAFQNAISRERDDAQRLEAGYARQLGTERQASATEAAAQNQMLSSAQAMGTIGIQQANLGQQQQAQLYQRLQELQRSGASQRQLEQAQFDIDKQQWEQEQQRPERQTAWMNQQLGQLPYQNVVQEGSYRPQAGPVSTALGAGIEGAGLWNAWQRRQAAQGAEKAAGGGSEVPWWAGENFTQ